MVEDGRKPPPLFTPRQDKEGTGWHVVIEKEDAVDEQVGGFKTEAEAWDWIVENSSKPIKK